MRDGYHTARITPFPDEDEAAFRTPAEALHASAEDFLNKLVRPSPATHSILTY